MPWAKPEASSEMPSQSAAGRAAPAMKKTSTTASAGMKIHPTSSANGSRARCGPDIRRPRSEELVLAGEDLGDRVVGENAPDRVGKCAGGREDLDVGGRSLAQ